MRCMHISTVCRCRFCFHRSKPSFHLFLLALEASTICTWSLEVNTLTAFWFSSSTASRSSVFSSTMRSIPPGTACAAAESASARPFNSFELLSLRSVSRPPSSEAKLAISRPRCSVTSSRAERTPRTSSSVFSPKKSVDFSSGSSSASTRAAAPSTRAFMRAEASPVRRRLSSDNASICRSYSSQAALCRASREARKDSCRARRCARSAGFWGSARETWSAQSRRRSLMRPCCATTFSCGGSGLNLASST
mmetsp:Transcript_37845/g.95004  ORF Transcript_37845/g.95004 Transcript_37845/m.95004 type:complete len:250 (-) Transcript_37845:223-972(-)